MDRVLRLAFCKGKQLNIGISGPIGAGKTTAAKYLASTYGFFYLRYSEVLAELLGRPVPERETLRTLGWDIMSHGQQLSLNQKLLSKMIDGLNYVVDGLRHPIDYQTLQSRPPFILLYIDAASDIRWQRLSLRDASKTWEEFFRIDTHPVESYLPILKEKAYKIFRNEGPIKELYAVLDVEIYEILGQEKK